MEKRAFYRLFAIVLFVFAFFFLSLTIGWRWEYSIRHIYQYDTSLMSLILAAAGTFLVFKSCEEDKYRWMATGILFFFIVLFAYYVITLGD